MSRQFHGAKHGNNEVSAQVVGIQYADGTVKKRKIRINGVELTAKAARAFADQVNAAATNWRVGMTAAQHDDNCRGFKTYVSAT